MDPTVLDTSAEADAIQRQVWQRLGPIGRLELAVQMSDDARELSITGVLSRRPELTRREALLAVVRQQLGDDLFEAAFGR